MSDDWGDDGWDDVNNAPKDAPKVEYELGEVVNDYYPDNHNDLPLLRYDIVYVFKKEGEWWEGEVNGIYGRFPGRCVRLNKDKPKQGDSITEALYFGKATLGEH